MKHFIFWLFALLFALPLLTPAKAADKLALSVGYYDILDDEDTVDVRVEYRWDEPLFWEISPFVGIEANGDGSLYGLWGLYGDIFLNDHIVITPIFGMGLYEHGDDGLDLGYWWQFRSQIEAGYEFDSNHRLSLGFGHISNASLDEENPGTEILSLYYMIPLNW